MRAVQRIVLVAQRIDQKPAPRSEGAELVDERQAVENVAAVEQQRQHGHRGQRHAAGKKRDHQKLQRARQNEQAARARPQEVVARLLHEQPVGDADGEEADQDRDRVMEGIGGRFAHGAALLSDEKWQ